MTHRTRDVITTAVAVCLAVGVIWLVGHPAPIEPESEFGPATTRHALRHDTSAALGTMAVDEVGEANAEAEPEPDLPPDAVAPPSEVAQAPSAAIRILSPAGAASVEQAVMGKKPAARMVANIEGAGLGFTGPQGAGRGGLDYSLAVGPDHIFAIVNGGGLHIWTKSGLPDPTTRRPMFDTTGRVLYGPVNVRQIWKGFGGQCDTRGSGDAVVRYDQLANRWLVVVPLFIRYPHIAGQMPYPEVGVPTVSRRGQAGQPGGALKLDAPDSVAQNAAAPIRRPPATITDSAARARAATPPSRPALPPDGVPPAPDTTVGTYGICYAVSTSPDPLGSYYRYEFIRPYFPDYPRPAIWPDGYYIPTSTSDNFIQKHACVADRAKMLKGEDATEQCIVVNGIPFLNMADLDGTSLPPAGAPNPVLAAGGSQLRGILEDSVLYSWQFHVDWKEPANTKLLGPVKIPVAPYHFLCDGQLTQCVPQPENKTRLDPQGDKLMARVTYRRIGNVEHLVAAHSINTSLNGGGVRWYEMRIDRDRTMRLHQQGTYAPGTAKDSLYRWLPSAAMDKFGNIGIGYSFGGLPHHVGVRFAGRQPNDPKGQLTMAEAIAVEGGGSQTASRWEDYTQTAVDPDDDCTIWHVGAYVRAGTTASASRISAFRMPGCK